MFPAWFLLAVSLAYVGVLFAIAWWGDRRAQSNPTPGRGKPLIYSLSLAVYCTSWTFYGAVGQAADTGWDFLPIYLGPMLVFAVFGAFMVRIVRVSKEQNITSIADFIASRYGKTQALAVLVTVVAVVGGLPYIALQLKAIAMGFNLLTTDPGDGYVVAAAVVPAWNDTALAVALLLALFTILFGTRHIDATEHHPGLMLAIAFESVVKLFAFLAVGIFVTWGLFDGLASVNPLRLSDANVATLFAPENLKASFLTNLALAMVAMFCLPRQFHTAVVENTHENDVRVARWLFPLYLAAIAFFIVPIAVAGLLTFPGGTVEADTYMLTLPMFAGREGLTLLALLGGFSAATGMVIVATVALSTMVSNDIVMPALLRMRWLEISERHDLGRVLLNVRRGTIFVLMVLAYFYYRLFGALDSLATIGLLAFAAVAQFAPAMIAGMFWNRANRVGAMVGLCMGFVIWAYTLLLPTLMRGAGGEEAPQWVEGPLGIGWLEPEALFGLGVADSFTHGVFWSLTINTLCLILFSLWAMERPIDRIQANAFVGVPGSGSGRAASRAGIATVGDFQALIERFLGARRTRQAFEEFAERQGTGARSDEPANAELVRHTERLLSGAIGASSARSVLTSALTGTGMRFDDVVALLDETSQKLQFRQELLQAAMENLSEGVSVIDSEMRLVAWNRRYLELFEYPDGLIYIGCPIERVLRFNAERGYCGPGDVVALVYRRMYHLRTGSPHFFERIWPDGTVLEIRGNPMPEGGFVTSFTDATERKRTEQALRESEESIRIYTDNVPALIAYVDNDLRFRFTNRAYEEALGIKREDLVGRKLDEVFDREEYLRRTQYLDGVFAGYRQSFEIELRTHDGSFRYALGTYIPHVDEQGGVIGFFSLFQDITDRRLAELRLQEANENLERRVEDRTRELTKLNDELSREISVRSQVEEALRLAKSEAEQANLSKTRFLAAASHDLLQPMNAARLFTSALSQDAENYPAKARQLVDRVDGSLRSAEELLSALLDISRLDAGALAPELGDFPINQILEALDAEFSAIARERGIEFHVVRSRHAVRSDHKLLRRVLQNFVANALRYTQQGRVTLGCRRSNGALSIQVWDTGPGIPEHQIKDVFQEFRRLHSHDVRGEKGLGLGLAIADRIARMLEHPIKVRSWPEHGSVFSVDVPLATGYVDHRSRGNGQRLPVSTRLAGLRVLCIDNEFDILDGMQALMDGWGCEVFVARGLDDALALCANGRAPMDVMLADYHLDRGVNGIDVMEAIQSRYTGRIAGIVITADHTEEVRRESLSRGYRFLQKPLKAAALRAVLNRMAGETGLRS